MDLGDSGASTLRVVVHFGRIWRYALSLVVAIGLICATFDAAAQNFRFTNVQIEGNQRIGASSILRTAGIARGETVSAGQVNSAVQRLQNSGLFETVEIEPRGSTLVIRVVEYPTINRISFEGNQRIKDDALAAIIESTERRVYSPSQAERDAAALAEAYSTEGRLASRVTPRVIRRTDNRVDLVFEIIEGDVTEIERLSFVGNRAFSDRRLRRVLQTKQAGIFRTFVRSDTLIEDRIAFDRQVLANFYLSRGYVDFRTNSVTAELTRQRDGYFLVFNVQEGQQFRFGEITVLSEIEEADEDLFLDAVRTKTGAVYTPSLVEADIARLERLGVQEGIDFLRVAPRVTRNDRTLTLDVEYVISRGPRVFVERIDIEGNTTTLDRVIRRQFRIVEGDPFNPREIRQSAERIRALGFFADAEVEAREGSAPDQVVVDVDVEEQPTGSLTLGGTYSTNDGFGLAVQFSERNFLGRGQFFSLNVSSTSDERNTGLTFREPALFGRDLELGLQASLVDSASSFANYDTTTILFQPSLEFPIGENSRLQTRYTARAIDMEVRSGSSAGSVITSEAAFGETVSSSVGYTFSYDTRRTGLNPNAGVLLSFGQDFAGLGGDNTYIKTTARAIAQTRVLREEVVLRATLEAGALSWTSGQNRAPDRFLLSPSILRGFEPGGIGPRQLDGTHDDALGGNYYFAARFDAEFPLGLPAEYGITGGAFYDIGNLWNLDGSAGSGAANVVGENGSLRHVIGVSLLWDTPFGPLRFNFSNALKKESFDKEQTFDLTISATF